MVQSKCSFDQIIESITTKYKDKDKGYTFCLPSIRSNLGDINGNKYTIIAGRQSSGKTSFVDQCWVVHPLMEWFYKKDTAENNLKIYYFSLKESPLNKLKSLMITYIKERYGIVLDKSVLDSEAGARYYLINKPEIYKCIEDSKQFIDIVLEHALRIEDNCSSISELISKVRTFLEDDDLFEHTNGNPEKIYHSDINTVVTLVIDDIDFLKMNDKSALWSLEFNQAMVNLKKVYGIEVVVIMPSARPSSITNPELTVPNYKDLGEYVKFCDKGIVLYNPLQEGFNKIFRTYNVMNYVTSKGSNLLRFVYIVRNANGPENISKRCAFLPQSSIFVELDTSDVINSADEVLEILAKQGPYSISTQVE